MLQTELMTLVLTAGLGFGTEAALRLPVQLYLDSLGATPLLISMGTSASLLGMLTGGALFGLLVGHVSTKILLQVALLLSAGSIALMTLQLPPEWFLAAVFVCTTCLFGLTPLVAGRLVSVRTSLHRAKWLSRFSVSRAIGVGVGKILSGYVTRLLGLATAFAAFAAVPVVGILLLVRWKSTDSLPKTSAEREVRAAGLRSQRLWALYLGILLSRVGVIGSQSLLFVYMYRLGVSIPNMGLISAIAPVAAAFSSILSYRLLKRITAWQLIVIGLVLTAMYPAAFLFSGPDLGFSGLVAGYLLVGASVGPLFVGPVSYIGKQIKVEDAVHGRLVGLFESSRGLGGLLGPPLAGLLVMIASYQLMFVTAAGIASLGLITVLVLLPKSPLQAQGAAVPESS